MPYFKLLIDLYISFGFLAVACNAFLPDSSPLNEQVNLFSGISALHRPASDTNLSLANRAAAGYLFSENTDERLNLTDPIDAMLSSILDRNGPDIKSSRDSRDFADIITMDVSKRAWLLLHEHASKAVIDRVELARPTIEQLLIDAKVSPRCLNSTKSIFDSAIDMESWAIKLINSWGNFPPIGIFEGTFSELGSYHTCVQIPKNNQIDHAHYCSISYRPVMASRRDYELVVREEPEELLNLFEGLKKNRASSILDQMSSFQPNNRDAFTDILKQAQYHHYIYYKWGTCWPIGCTPFDVRRVAKLVGRRNILMTGPVKCYSINRDDYEYMDPSQPAHSSDDASDNSTTQLDNRKLIMSTWDLNNGIFIYKPHFFTAHKVALAILVSITAFILFMTGTDIIVNRVPHMLRFVRFALLSVPMENGAPNIQPTHIELQESQVCKRPSSVGGTLNDVCKLPSEGHSNETTASLETNISPCSIPEQEVIYRQTAAGDKSKRKEITGFMSYVDDCSILNNCEQFFTISGAQLKNDILCLNGIRCLTMIWIILTHTMMYCDWSGFARTIEIEKSLKSLIGQPIFNGSYLVDTFFLMSGLLSAFTVFKQCKGSAEKFKSIPYVVGRWLRLTPQILFLNLVFILLPALSHGPHWFPLVGEYSENCANNWWINMFHIQAFYNTEKMCSFVTWWVSVDFFFHYTALLIIWVILWGNHRFGFLAITGLVCSQVTYEMFKHYQKAFPPNIFSTIPQTGAMWTEMTLEFFWKPYTHAVPFFFGFYVGYLMAMKQKLILRFLNPRRALIGWTVAITALICQSFSTYWWVTGVASYSRLVSTISYAIFPMIWASSLCWIIIACHHGYGGFLNRFLSMKMWIVLGKASYLVYLSHFQILFTWFGGLSILLEPTGSVMLYVILGNIFVSAIYGILLCIVYEHPWLKFQRRIMKRFF